MKKIIVTIVIGILLLVAFSACEKLSQYVAVPVIPPDPVPGATEPASVSHDVALSGSVAKIKFLPTDIEPQVKVTLNSIIDPDTGDPYTDLTADNFQLFEDGKEQGFVLRTGEEVAGKLDIFFAIDTTGSMEHMIDGVKSSVIDFANLLKSSGYDVALGVIPFTDDVGTTHGDFIDLTTDLSASGEFMTYVNSMEQSMYGDYGGDGPENPYDTVVHIWNHASWRHGAQRIIIVMTDAAAHYPGDGTSYARNSEEDVINTLAGGGVIHTILWPSYESNYSYCFPEGDVRRLSTDTGGVTLLTDSSGNVDLSTLGIASTISKSWVLIFDSDSPSETHNVHVVFKKDPYEGELKLENVTY
ncbi:MAG: VWA domain-containing protein [Thermotoga sp.]|nr:MAG: VWA domain-containing protein [Thermotoga sp.]